MKYSAVATLAASVCLLAACDQQPETSSIGSALEAQREFDLADANKDGVVTRSEASSLTNLDFGTADADGNQTLTPQEFEVALTRPAPPGG
jgi:hypothetical protein